MSEIDLLISIFNYSMFCYILITISRTTEIKTGWLFIFFILLLANLLVGSYGLIRFIGA